MDRQGQATRRLAVALPLVLLLALAPRAAVALTLTIGTAGVMGIYHPLGGAVCRILNVTRKVHGLRCQPESSEGSVANLRGVSAGTLAMGIAQADIQYDARAGSGPFAGEPQPRLRVLFSVYLEALTLVARESAAIRSVADLKGKRVAIGTSGSGTRATMDRVLAAAGVRRDALKAALEPSIVAMPPLLCDNRMDAFAFVVGHPNAVVQDAATGCHVRIVPVAGPHIDALVASHPYYVVTAVPGGIYPGNPNAQPTIGTMASVVVSADMTDEVAYAITRAVFENFDDFRKLNPALATLTREAALTGSPLPFHPGAERYFREVGLPLAKSVHDK